MNGVVILISFDIDGTLEVGDPPGAVTMDMVRIARRKGFFTGSCSDRPMSTQRDIWSAHGIGFDFVCYKHTLSEIKNNFDANAYWHIGDRDDLDRKYAVRAGFDFLWPDEAAEMEWFLIYGYKKLDNALLFSVVLYGGLIIKLRRRKSRS